MNRTNSINTNNKNFDANETQQYICNERLFIWQKKYAASHSAEQKQSSELFLREGCKITVGLRRKNRDFENF